MPQDPEAPAEQPQSLPRVRVEALDSILGRPFPVLDQGFVRVVDYLGDDGAIVQAARVSYGAGTKRVHEDRGLIRYLMRHRHCYDSETEVLTESGFRPWPEVTAETVLGAWDPEAGTLCYERPAYVTHNRYSGHMYRVDHGGVDLLVTPDHKMFVRTKIWEASSKKMFWSPLRLVPALELGNRSMVRYKKTAPLLTAPWRGDGLPEHRDSQALLELIGFFIGDGCAKGTRANGIEFHLKNPRETAFLDDCTRRVGWEFKERPSYDGRRKFTIYGPGIGHQFKRLFYAGSEKRLPAWALRLDQADAQALLTGLRNSDGSQKRGAWELFTKYRDLAHQVQLVALHAGEAAHINARNNGMYGVMFLSRMTDPSVNQGKEQTSWEDYEGNVHCAATRTGVLVVRRNGKIVLCGNSTPFEMCEIKLHVRVPMDCWRQWQRHRTSSTNEYSTRYSVAIDAAQTTPPEGWRLQATGNRQGSESLLEPSVGAELSRQEADLQRLARRVYEERLATGVAREQARKDLPLSTYTEAYWKANLHNLLHFIELRIDDHAQLEIRSYARVIAHEIVARWVPLAWEAFRDYRLESLSLSRIEAEVVRALAAGDAESAARVLREAGLLAEGAGGLLRNRERSELEAKLRLLRLPIPWKESPPRAASASSGAGAVPST